MPQPELARAFEEAMEAGKRPDALAIIWPLPMGGAMVRETKA